MQKGASKPFAPNAGLQKSVHRVQYNYREFSSPEVVTPRMLSSPEIGKDIVFKGSGDGQIGVVAKSPKASQQSQSRVTSAQILRGYHQEFLESKERERSVPQTGDNSIESERPQVTNKNYKVASKLQVSPNFTNPFSSPRLIQAVAPLKSNDILEPKPIPSTLGQSLKHFSHNSQLLHQSKHAAPQNLLTAQPPSLLKSAHSPNATLNKNDTTLKSLSSKLSPYLLTSNLALANPNSSTSDDYPFKGLPAASSLAYSPTSFQSAIPFNGSVLQQQNSSQPKTPLISLAFPYQPNNYNQQNMIRDTTTTILGGATNTSEVVDQLKEHLMSKYPQYNDQKIEQLIYKFLNEYLISQIGGGGGQVEHDMEYSPNQYQMVGESQVQSVGDNQNDYILLEKDERKVLTLKGCSSARDQTVFVDNQKYQDSLYEQVKLTNQKVSKKYNSTFEPILQLPLESDDDQQPPFSRQEGDSEASSSFLTASLLDWNDKDQIERHIIRQIERQREAEADAIDKTSRRGMPLRMSEYFGALKIDELNEEDEPHQKLNQLFEECFGFKLNQGATTESRESIQEEQDTDEVPLPDGKHLPNKNQMPATIQGKKQELQKSTAAETQQPSIGTQTLGGDSSKLVIQSMPNIKDMIMQSNTVNNDQSCQIIVNFYNVKCNTPKGASDLQAAVDAATSAKPHKIILNTQVSPGRTKFGISTDNGGACSLTTKAANGDAFKKTKFQKGMMSSSQDNHKVKKIIASPKGISNLSQSIQGKQKKGQNILTIQDQQIIFDNQDSYTHFISKKSDDFQSSANTNYMLPGVTNPYHYNIHESQPNFGSIVENKAGPGQSPNSFYPMSGLKNTSLSHPDPSKAFEANLSNPHTSTHANSKQFFKNILYKNQNLSLQQQKVDSIGGHSGSPSHGQQQPAGGTIAHSFNNHMKLKQKTGVPLNHFPSQLKILPQLFDNTSNSRQHVEDTQPQRMQTAGSSSTMFHTHMNESQERGGSEERDRGPMKTLNTQQKLKAKKIGSIISMKALRNDLMGITSQVSTSQNQNSYMTQYALQKSAAQGTALQNLKKARPTRNHGLLPPTQPLHKQYKSYQDAGPPTGHSPTSDSDELIQLKFRGGVNGGTFAEMGGQRSSRSRHKPHFTSDSITKSAEHSASSNTRGVGSSIGSQSHRSNKGRKNGVQISQTVGLGSPRDALALKNHKSSKRMILSPHEKYSKQIGQKMTRPDSSKAPRNRDQTQFQLSMNTVLQMGGSSPRIVALTNSKNHVQAQSRNNNNTRLNTQASMSQFNQVNQLQGKPPKRYLSPSSSLSLQQQQKALQKIYFPKGQKEQQTSIQIQSGVGVTHLQNHSITVPHSNQSQSRPMTRFYNSVSRQTPRNLSKESQPSRGGGSKETNYQQLQHMKHSQQHKRMTPLQITGLEKSLEISQLHYLQQTNQQDAVRVFPCFTTLDQTEAGELTAKAQGVHFISKVDTKPAIAISQSPYAQSTASQQAPFFYIKNSGVARATKGKKKLAI